MLIVTKERMNAVLYSILHNDEGYIISEVLDKKLKCPRVFKLYVRVYLWKRHILSYPFSSFPKP